MPVGWCPVEREPFAQCDNDLYANVVAMGNWHPHAGWDVALSKPKQFGRGGHSAKVWLPVSRLCAQVLFLGAHRYCPQSRSGLHQCLLW